MTARALITLPTYNEVENVPTLVPAIREATGGSDEFEILVVDDGSPDGTADAARALGSEDPGVHLLDRGAKLGLGTAYRAGFEFARERGFTHAFTMDADLSHSPAHLPAMWEAAKAGADLVIGSRYIPGGGISNWPWHRRALSATANAVARATLRLRARDCTSGFRCYSLDLLARLDLDAIRSTGYSYLTEVLFRCQQLGARVEEVPIVFTDRTRGTSKISKHEIWRAMLTLARLRLRGGR